KAFLDIRVNADGQPATQSAGSVHHIAWRTESDASQLEWINRIRSHGLQTTDVIDRNYFHSIYFRQPGGVLFEIATDGPGFMVDEDKQSLGQALKLPAQYESRREHIESVLIPIKQ
ncbi:MAG: VOC family protein, partial [Calditrichaeota bacterium]|nr:VOC family protein [Calditrichota bacterium]